LRHRDGFRDQFGHASDLVTLPILQMMSFMESIVLARFLHANRYPLRSKTL
jgi:hypothetical protein